MKVRLSGDAVGRLHDGGDGVEYGRSDMGDIQNFSEPLHLPNGECVSIAYLCFFFAVCGSLGLGNTVCVLCVASLFAPISLLELTNEKMSAL